MVELAQRLVTRRTAVTSGASLPVVLVLGAIGVFLVIGSLVSNIFAQLHADNFARLAEVYSALGHQDRAAAALDRARRAVAGHENNPAHDIADAAFPISKRCGKNSPVRSGR